MRKEFLVDLNQKKQEKSEEKVGLKRGEKNGRKFNSVCFLKTERGAG